MTLELFNIFLWLKDFIVYSLFYVLPFGLGLFFLAPLKKSLVKDEHSVFAFYLLFSYFIGRSFIGLFLYNLESFNYLSSGFAYFNLSIHFFSFFGFFIWKDFLIKNQLLKEVWSISLKASPIFIISYIFINFYLYRYPLRDVFQDMYFIKGATEIARFNTYTIIDRDTYAPTIQALWGLIKHNFGLDLIKAQWVAPIYNYFFYSLYIIIFLKSALKFQTKEVLTVLVIFICAKFYGLGHQNGTTIFAISLAIIGYIISNFETRNVINKFVFFSIIFFTIVCLFVIYNFNVTFALIAVMLSLLVVLSSHNLKQICLIGLVVLSGISTHRTLFIFMAACIWISFLYWFLFVRRKSFDFFKLRKALVFLTSVLAVLFIFIFNVRFFSYFKLESEFLNQVILQSNKLINYLSFLAMDLASMILKKDFHIGNSVDIGGGLNNSFYENIKMQTIPVIALALISLKALYVKNEPLQKKIIFFVSVYLSLLVMTLNPIPFTHRMSILSSFFATVLCSLLLINISSIFSKMEKTLVFVTLFTLELSLFFIAYLFKNGDQLKFYYLNIVYIFWIISFCTGAILLLINSKTKKTALYTAAFCFLILSNQFFIFGLFSHNAFPNKNSKLPISHYSKAELELVKKLDTDLFTTFVSDPYSMTTFKSLLGVQSIAVFSNIDLIGDEYGQLLKNILNSIFTSDYTNTLDYIRAYLKKDTPPELRYHLRTKLGIKLDYESSQKSLDKFIFIIDKRTIEWTYCNDDIQHCNFYFPDEKRLPAEIILRIYKNYHVLHNIDDRIIVFKLRNLF